MHVFFFEMCGGQQGGQRKENSGKHTHLKVDACLHTRVCGKYIDMAPL